MDPVDFVTEPTSEEQRVWQWKVEQLESLGFTIPDAVYLAASPDIDVLPVARKLIAGGCKHDVALQILG